MTSDGGKGSLPRPYSVDRVTFDQNYEAIFGKNSPLERKKREEALKKLVKQSEELGLYDVVPEQQQVDFLKDNK